MNLRVLATNGSQFLLHVLETTSWGDERLEFTFDLGWASGKIHLVCSKKRLEQLEWFLQKRSFGDGDSYCFINEDGNLEITISRQSTGLFTFQVIAFPNMVDDDRIEFRFDGMIEK